MARHCGVLPDNPGNGQLLRSCPPELTAGQGCQSQEPARELGQQLPQAPQAPLGQHTPHGCTRVHSRVREKACCPHACACVCMCACVHACLCACMSACPCVCVSVRAYVLVAALASCPCVRGAVLCMSPGATACLLLCLCCPVPVCCGA